MKTDDPNTWFQRTDANRLREQRDAREVARITGRACLIMTGVGGHDGTKLGDR
jgi:hypothetical protein